MKHLPRVLTVSLALATNASLAQTEAVPLQREQGLLMLDYQRIPVPGLPALDLAGIHFFTRFGEGLYLGVGASAPLVRGEYGGFMTVDLTGHWQRRLFGRVVGTAGLALGGGGGGKSAEQSKVLSGSGGYGKLYAGLGYEFDHFTVGLNVARVRFTGSAIGHTQPNLFVQVPFSYSVGPYASAGRRSAAPEAAAEDWVSFGLDNFKQVDPTGSNKGVINLVSLQYARFFAPDSYWFAEASLGWRGLPLYNHVTGGVGQRFRVAPNLNLYAQLGVGSGGYAPDTIDTGPGLLVYPKLAAEYMVSRQLGVAVTAGHMAAPRGTSKNWTLGAQLNVHLGGAAAGGETLLRGWRYSVMQQTEFGVRVANQAPPDIRMLTMQVDGLLNERWYLPVQISVAANAYAGYPGYGEVLVGAGVQSTYAAGERWQFFGQLLAGPNVHGIVLKPMVGLNFSLTDRLALHLQAGKTIGLDNYGQNTNKQKFRASALGLGLTYRFSAPGG